MTKRSELLSDINNSKIQLNPYRLLYVYICLIFFSSFSKRISVNHRGNFKFLDQQAGQCNKVSSMQHIQHYLDPAFPFNHEGVFPIQVPSPM